MQPTVDTKGPIWIIIATACQLQIWKSGRILNYMAYARASNAVCRWHALDAFRLLINGIGATYFIRLSRTDLWLINITVATNFQIIFRWSLTSAFACSVKSEVHKRPNVVAVPAGLKILSVIYLILLNESDSTCIYIAIWVQPFISYISFFNIHTLHSYPHTTAYLLHVVISSIIFFVPICYVA